MKIGLFYLVVLVGLFSCTINKQVKEIKTLGECKFAIHSIEKIDVSGTDVKKIVQTGEVNLTSMPAIALGFLTRNIPLTTNFVLEITNPTLDKAAINQFDYQLFINQQKF